MNTSTTSSSEEKSVELEEFIERISKIDTISEDHCETVIEYIRLLYRSDAKARELINNGDIHGLRFYLNFILAKYGDLTEICEYFKDGDLNTILYKFTEMRKKCNISFKNWMREKGYKLNTYYEDQSIQNKINDHVHERFLLKDYYEQVMRYDFSDLHELCTRVDNLGTIDNFLKYYESKTGQMGK